MYIAKIMMHRWEEEPISGIEHGYKGTLAIFFYGCNMKCVFCQNSKISREKVLGKSNTKIEELADKIIEGEKDGACTISFITGALQIDEIVKTINLVKDKIKIPIVYNSNGYETVSQIKKLDGLIDIYLPDFKYMDKDIGLKYSGVPNYPDIAKSCVDEMVRQGKRVIVRHLVLPTHTEDSKYVLKYLFSKYGNNITYSIMAQYTPMLKNEGIDKYPELMRKLTKREYEKVIDFAISIGIENAYTQDIGSSEDTFIPDFMVK